VYRVGFVSMRAGPEDNAQLDAFRQGLRELGYVEGRNVMLEIRYAAGREERLAGFAVELARLKLDVIVAQSSVAAVIVFDCSRLHPSAARITELARTHRLPALYPFSLYPETGGLMSYGPSVREAAHRAAGYVDRILKGARPADLPVEQPTIFELVINGKTAKAPACGFRIGPRAGRSAHRVNRGPDGRASLCRRARSGASRHLGHVGTASSTRHTGPFRKKAPSNFTNAGTAPPTSQYFRSGGSLPATVAKMPAMPPTSRSTR
jgi:hypothetical protein